MDKGKRGVPRPHMGHRHLAHYSSKEGHGGAKSAKFGLSFRHRSPLSRSRFEIDIGNLKQIRWAPMMALFFSTSDTIRPRIHKNRPQVSAPPLKIGRQKSQQLSRGLIESRKCSNSAGRWWMFLLFVGTSDVEQIGLELSLESVQCHLWSPQSSWKTVAQGRSCNSEAPPADHGLGSGKCSTPIEADLRC